MPKHLAIPVQAAAQGDLALSHAWLRRQARQDEVDDLRALLLEHAAPDVPAMLTHALARRIAEASLGDGHLWEDMRLSSRAELGLLMERYFPRLKALNASGMRWKKFLYRQLCLKHEVLICRSPSCAVCDEASLCFGPETAGTA